MGMEAMGINAANQAEDQTAGSTGSGSDRREVGMARFTGETGSCRSQSGKETNAQGSWEEACRNRSSGSCRERDDSQEAEEEHGRRGTYNPHVGRTD